MKRNLLIASLGAVLFGASMAGCPTDTVGPNAFLTLAEEFGAASIGTDNDGTTGGSGTGTGSVPADIPFRQTMSVTMNNTDMDFDVEVSVAAWVLPSSLRDTSQQDALIEDGYVELTSELELGVYTLPVGTFIRDGGGFAGAQKLLIGPEGESSLDMVTPDVLLVYNEVPRNCESVAFQFLSDGLPLVEDLIRGDTVQGATNAGSRKTLAQIDAYQCSPFQPGLFFKNGGGARQNNEFFEGQNVSIAFSLVANAGVAGVVTIQ